ncbi:glycosyltransferase [Pseudoduganella chitinolytica]|uniref:Glycosyltransferase n=1 Tax=Pseudoduganella chitinolytica TaxID=34070 RepID=A0ABY8B9Z7_9BURK|nr:glycosyltransferase [Pseudoduganella chitinolytica]WEF32258.1 glycosyltransferase [Pseudoduganella chitinolytica]
MSHLVPDAIGAILDYHPRINFICCVNDEAVYENVLLASLKHNRYKSLTKVVGASSAAQAFNENVVKHAPGEITVLVHQDVYLPPNWTDAMEAIYDNLPFGVAGCVGCRGQQIYADVFASPTIYLDFNINELPTPVDSLDELILIFPSATPIRLDEELGWHMYGADACVKAKQFGQQALVIKNRVVHYSKRTEFDEKFWKSAALFRDKNPGPIKTTIITIDEQGNITSP